MERRKALVLAGALSTSVLAAATMVGASAGILGFQSDPPATRPAVAEAAAGVETRIVHLPGHRAAGADAGGAQGVGRSATGLTGTGSTPAVAAAPSPTPVVAASTLDEPSTVAPAAPSPATAEPEVDRAEPEGDRAEPEHQDSEGREKPETREVEDRG